MELILKRNCVSSSCMQWTLADFGLNLMHIWVIVGVGELEERSKDGWMEGTQRKERRTDIWNGRCCYLAQAECCSHSTWGANKWLIGWPGPALASFGSLPHKRPLLGNYQIWMGKSVTASRCENSQREFLFILKAMKWHLKLHIWEMKVILIHKSIFPKYNYIRCIHTSKSWVWLLSSNLYSRNFVGTHTKKQTNKANTLWIQLAHWSLSRLFHLLPLNLSLAGFQRNVAVLNFSSACGLFHLAVVRSTLAWLHQV